MGLNGRQTPVRLAIMVERKGNLVSWSYPYNPLTWTSLAIAVLTGFLGWYSWGRPVSYTHLTLPTNREV